MDILQVKKNRFEKKIFIRFIHYAYSKSFNAAIGNNGGSNS